MNTIVTIILLTLAIAANGQSTPEIGERYKYIDSLYTDGFKAYLTDFRSQIYYPSEIKTEGIIGIIYFEASVDTTGHISDFKILCGIDPRLDSIVKEKFHNTNGKWRIQIDEKNRKIPFIITDYVYFELR